MRAALRPVARLGGLRPLGLLGVLGPLLVGCGDLELPPAPGAGGPSASVLAAWAGAMVPGAELLHAGGTTEEGRPPGVVAWELAAGAGWLVVLHGGELPAELSSLLLVGADGAVTPLSVGGAPLPALETFNVAPQVVTVGQRALVHYCLLNQERRALLVDPATASAVEVTPPPGDLCPTGGDRQQVVLGSALAPDELVVAGPPGHAVRLAYDAAGMPRVVDTVTTPLPFGYLVWAEEAAPGAYAMVNYLGVAQQAGNFSYWRSDAAAASLVNANLLPLAWTRPGQQDVRRDPEGALVAHTYDGLQRWEVEGSGAVVSLAPPARAPMGEWDAQHGFGLAHAIRAEDNGPALRIPRQLWSRQFAPATGYTVSEYAVSPCATLAACREHGEVEPLAVLSTAGEPVTLFWLWAWRTAPADDEGDTRYITGLAVAPSRALPPVP